MDAVFQADGGESPGAQQLDRLQRQDAVGSAAVGHDLPAVRQLGQARLELAQRQRNGPRDVAGPVLLGRPDVDHGDAAASHALEQLLAIHCLEAVPPLQEAAHDLIDVGEPLLREDAHVAEEGADRWIGDPADHALAVLAALDQAGAAQDLQVAGRVRDRQA